MHFITCGPHFVSTGFLRVPERSLMEGRCIAPSVAKLPPASVLSGREEEPTMRMTKRTSTLLTGAMALLFFFIGLGISTYQTRESERLDTALFVDPDRGSAEEAPFHSSTHIPEDDGCFTGSDREVPDKMRQSLMEESLPGSAIEPVSSDAVQDPDALQEGDLASPGTSGGTTVAPPKMPPGGGTGVDDSACQRPRPSTGTDCPEL